MELITVLAVRVGSERFPGKMLADVQGQPLVSHIIDRLKVLSGMLVLATTKRAEDLPLCELAKQAGIPFYRGSADDVVGRVDETMREFAPDAKFVFRALGDCPFLATELVERSVEIMAKAKAEAFLWQLTPDCWPVYGAREFPFSRLGWDRIVKETNGEEREHVDLYFHRNRDRFRIVYHEPPSSVYFRQYRLEVDWPEDLTMVRQIARFMGMNGSLADVIRYLDAHPSVPRLNRHRLEATGPLTSYDFHQRRAWMKAMRGKPVHSWNGEIWQPPSKGDDAQPVFCNAGCCLLGWGFRGVLHTPTAQIRGDAMVECKCGVGRLWKKAR